MEGLVVGDVVVVPFPFSDLSDSKRRPAVVVANLASDDVILCQVTSQALHDPLACRLAVDDFASGSLRQTSFARAGKVFAADRRIVLYRAGSLKPQVVRQILETIIDLFTYSDDA